LFEDNILFLRSLDPKDSKEQDHYKVLGIPDLRFKATDDQIKRAYRQKVLKHHPDKRRGQGEEIKSEDDYFTCITTAFENLGTPNKRRAYDSVDHTFEEEIPDAIKASETNKDFYKVFGPVLESNARWSTRQPVPKLGDKDRTRGEVDKFYKFWYDFESWREYSYLDEEDKEKGSDREERRWIEKNNRVQRAEKKKEDMKRIRKLVDNAYNCDPRIQKFKDDDKEEKASKKKAKQDAGRMRREAEEKEQRDAEEKAKREQEEKDRIEKEKREKEKLEKDTIKKAMKKERKTVKTVAKECDYFSKEDDSDRVQNLTDLDWLCEILSLEELTTLNSQLNGKSKAEGRTVFLKTVQDLKQRLEKEKLKEVEKATKGASGNEKVSTLKSWSGDELALLIKAVNLFPAGTVNRYILVFVALLCSL
jgi:DnaJ family protein C protein 2